MGYLRFTLDEIPEVQKIGVYGIHNKVNDRYYIGSTNNIYHRFCLYFRFFNDGCGINRKMYEDFSSDSDRDNFEIIVFETFDNDTITIDELRKAERRYIEKYDSINNGYNTDLPHNGNIPMGTILRSKDYMSERRKNALVCFVPVSLKEKMKRLAKQGGYKNVTSFLVDLIESDIAAHPQYYPPTSDPDSNE